MKRSLLALCAVAALFSVPAAHAEPKNITTVSMEHISQLETMHQKAIDSLLQNDFEGALQVYLDILLKEPDDETAYTGLGQIYLVMGQFKKAHDAFQNALMINPDNDVALQGIQKIMDPDGVEGMVSRAQAEGLTEAPLVEPGFAQPAKMMKRLGPRSPVQKKTVPAPVKKRAPKNFRLGLLNAQRVQMSLKNAGVYEGPVNGMIGRAAQDAVKRFQETRGFEQTGRVDPITRQALLSCLG
jgi:tetratricopeptide (TPR) repeat protein